MNSVQFKYNVGDVVYYKKHKNIESKGECPICEGAGELYSKNGNASPCFHCSGTGKVVTGARTIEVAEPISIDTIRIEINNDGTYINYVSHEFDVFSTVKLFPTREECEATFDSEVRGYACASGYTLPKK